MDDVIIGGDFNSLKVSEVTARTGLIPLVNAPTRGNKVLDMLMAPADSAYQIKVITSAIRSDHKAILATSGTPPRDRTKCQNRCTFRRLTPGQHASMLQMLSAFNDEGQQSDSGVAWNEFYQITTSWLDEFYPERTVSISSRDPDFVTPEIKYLLSHRNAAMRRNRKELAAALTSRVGYLIEKQNKRSLSRVNKAAGTGQLWKAVNKLTGKQSATEADLPLSVEDMNSFYAAASTDTEYLEPVLKATASPDTTLCNEYNIFFILDKLKPTADGLDHIPAWFLRLLAPFCSGCIARLFNLSLNSSTIPEQWRVARIRPVAKTKTPTGPGDFRPISVVPVLSRVLERIVVSRYIYPALAEPPINKLIQDQFAFIHSFITEIYIAPLQGYYSEALPTLARLKRRVLRLHVLSLAASRKPLGRRRLRI